MTQGKLISILNKTYLGWRFQYFDDKKTICGKQILTQYRGKYYFDYKFNINEISVFSSILKNIEEKIGAHERKCPTQDRILLVFSQDFQNTTIYKFTPDCVKSVINKILKSLDFEILVNSFEELTKPNENNIHIDYIWPDELIDQARRSIENNKRDWVVYNEKQKWLDDYKKAINGDTVLGIEIILNSKLKDYYPYLHYSIRYLD